MTITGRNATIIIVDDVTTRPRQRQLLVALLAELAAREACRVPSGDFTAIELKCMAHTAPPRWMFEQAPAPRKKPKGPRNRWGGLK